MEKYTTANENRVSMPTAYTFALVEYDRYQDDQHNIFIECGPIAQGDSISKASAIRDGLPYSIYKGENGKKYHHWEKQPGGSLYPCIKDQ